MKLVSIMRMSLLGSGIAMIAFGSWCAIFRRWVDVRFLAATPKEIRSISGGANNRACEVKALQGKYLLKEYVRSPEDSRDRLSSEKGFYHHA